MSWKIHDGQVDAFKSLSAEATALVEQSEPNMLGYQWYMNADPTECTLIEQYPSAEHILVHFSNVGETRRKLLEIADISINVFGEIGDDALAALDPLGAV